MTVLVAALAITPLAQAQEKPEDILKNFLGELLKGPRDVENPTTRQPSPDNRVESPIGRQPLPPDNRVENPIGQQPAPWEREAPPDAGEKWNPTVRVPGGPDDNRRLPFSRQQIQLSFAPLVEKTAPAVVNVYAARQVAARSPFGGDPFFEQFFGRRQMPPRLQKSLGSGVIVDATGIVVTNYHVIADADEVKVALSDGREYESRVLLKEESLDLAVLKIDDNRRFPALPFGNSEALLVGDLVLAIGNPFGVGQTTTSGIVSALARTHVGVSDFGFFIQTDAAINPGNSGGALIDMNGQLVGINTAIFTRSGGSNGIGFAIPSNLVRAVVGAARRGVEAFERPWLGAEFQPVTAAVADSLGMGRPIGALVGNVTRNSPAERSGLRPGDVVLAINGFPVEHPDALGYRLATLDIGSTAVLQVLRRGKLVAVKAVLESEPDNNPGRATLTIDGKSPFAGAVVTTLNGRLVRKLRLRRGAEGVAIIDIKGGAPASRFGLQPGDIVLELNGVAIETPQQLAEVANQDSRWWKFAIDRRGRVLRQTLRY